ncbi:MAG: ATP-dependent nuclease [Anaerolineae bacterium]|jgi:putative ATP-dependent endonuclease of OLD family
MRLTHLRIRNFRSCRDISLELGGLHAFVGANNSGKSSVLRAMDILFNPSSRSLNEESFWNKDASLEIRIEAVFTELTDAETETLGPYLRPDGSFMMARTAKIGGSGDEQESAQERDEDKITISQQYQISVPEPEWLQEARISGTRIKEWWGNRPVLVAGGVSFADFLGTSSTPTVAVWKEKASEFVATHRDKIPFREEWIENPRGYANVLKGILPFFVLVPAVRDVAEEARGTKTSPFGRLLSAILGAVTQDKREKIEGFLDEVARQMNRSGGEERVPFIADTEDRLRSLLGDMFPGCDLEIEFETPTLEVLLSAPKLYIDDGFRNAVENKGHGLQRAVIFAILRRYAEHMTASPDGRKRSLILAVEEPELYMHPQAQRTIRGVFGKIAQSGDQVFFTTHSALLVDVAHFDEIVRMEGRQHAVDGHTTRVSLAWQLPMTRMIRDIETRRPELKGRVTTNSIRDLYSHAYNPRRNEGFFASKIVLVEGLTEEYSLPIYADALPGCSFDPMGISVVECGGKGSMDRIYRIFNELHIPCYMLFDYDYGNPDANIIEKSRELLTLAGLPADAPQTLLVGDCVACFPNKWEIDLGAEIPDGEVLSKDARQALGADVGKPLIARYIARRLTECASPYVPPSLAVIIEKAVTVEWTKSCLAQSESAHTEAAQV